MILAGSLLVGKYTEKPHDLKKSASFSVSWLCVAASYHGPQIFQGLEAQVYENSSLGRFEYIHSETVSKLDEFLEGAYWLALPGLH